ncbi:MAG: (deoxy)nucleoside triphosphate pyrophosphohydrolase [Deltaproteobacteria bacterium]|nr:(deoxy)nucleoside triphosphate pyrophosphohydrolase [Deltaproteobacteria bacterium]
MKPHFDVTAGLIRREGKVLITKRPRGSHLAGLWELPGGKREEGEGLRGCLEREIREELGMGVRAERRLFTVPYEYETKRITLHIFDCVDLGDAPVALEGQEMKWVPPEELPSYSFPPPDLKVIRTLAREAKLSVMK